MRINYQIEIRLSALKLAAKEIREAYEESKIDAYSEFGIEYEKPYVLVPGEVSIFKKADELAKRRKDVLFYRIFCFTQVFYSLKDYISKLYPEKKVRVESFFNEKDKSQFIRKRLANDLKHNPSKDIRFGFTEKRRERKSVNGHHQETIVFDWSWNWNNLDTIDYCEDLLLQMDKFIHQEFG